MSTIIIGSGGGGGNGNHTATLLQQAADASPHMTAGEHAAIVNAEQTLCHVIESVLKNIAER